MAKNLDGRVLYPHYERQRKEINKVIDGGWEDLRETDYGVEGKKIDAERLQGLIMLVQLLEEEVIDLHRKIDALNRKIR